MALPPSNPCIPSPCGPFSECRNVNGVPSCTCRPSYSGAPPQCRPECTISSECSSNLACINQKCRDPCPGSCGLNAICSVYNHIPICNCIDGYIGDPFSNCNPKPPPRKYCLYILVDIECDGQYINRRNFPSTAPEPVATDPCNPSPCGPNAQCRDGICTCLPEYQGNPYEACRPECIMNSECSTHLACIRNKCKDPCPGLCGQDALCTVYNHIPMCTCPASMTGNAFIQCSPFAVEHVNPCSPSPCGPNSRCREYNGQATCSCIENFVGSPPSCRPECVVSSDCGSNEACLNQKCRDPCPGTCGVNARCHVTNHNPLCTCLSGFTGDAFTRCTPIRKCSFGVRVVLHLGSC